MPEALRAESISYRYPGANREALVGFSAEFPAGSSTAIMGSTGAGKSTLLRALTGVISAAEPGDFKGRIRYGSADFANYRVQTLTRYIGLVLQDPASQIIGRTVGEDVAFGPRNHLLPRAEINRRVAESLRVVGLDGLAHRSTGELSGGELQRLAIAGTLALGPEVLCLDEATSELDPLGAADVRRVIASLQDSGITVIAAEHDPAAVLGAASRLLVLDDGRLAWQGEPEAFFADPAQAEQYGIRPLPMSVLVAELVRRLPELAPSLSVLPRPPLTVAQTTNWLREVLPAGSMPSVATLPTPSTAPVVIELENLRFGYSPQTEVLHDINLSVHAGEFVALIGANGAGKTTVAKHLNGLLRPTAGRVRICGREVSDQATWQLAGQVGYVFQNPDHQIFCRTVAEEVGFALRVAGRPEAEVKLATAEVLDLTGLVQVADQNPFALPRGQRQLVAMASSLIAEPEILVIDEPTTGQDWRGVQAIMTLVTELNRRGTTIVMISHDLELVGHYAQRVVRIDDGRVVADGPAETQVTTQLRELWHACFGADPSVRDEVAAAGQLARLHASAHEPGVVK